MSGPTRFTIDVPQEALTDLRARLTATRRIEPPVLGADEDTGLMARIDALIEYWADGFDWPRQQRRLNEVPQYRADVDGVGLHFVHVRGTGTEPLPLLLTNGWPSSFVEYLGVLGPLADPAAHGGQAQDSFDIVIPALPGFGFSDHCRDRRLTRTTSAGLFHSLMTDVLGYRRYVVHGDDIGGGVANRLGMRHSGAPLAIQTANWVTPDLHPDDPTLTSDERRYLLESARWEQRHGAYDHVQATRPHTLAAGLNDSPAGLAYWILEKFLTWSDPRTRARLNDDDLLATVTIYWVTQTIASSVRSYALPPVAPSEIVTPSFIVVPNEPDLPKPPEAILRRLYRDLRGVDRIQAGGHFLAAECGADLVSLIRANLSPHRHTA